MGHTILITGGAGFIGVNAARHYCSRGWRVVVLDNLSRRGADKNIDWLRAETPAEFHRIDIRDRAAVDTLVATVKPKVLLHLAAQVAVTTSVDQPREDFEVNALGTFNVLDAMRRGSPESLFINASTNKVYGGMEDVAIEERDERYCYRDLAGGVDERRGLDFHSPYGCSKGSADQYTLDFGRIYGLKTTTMRQSCIYGPHQFGVEDQGWVAWFTIAATQGRRITIFGDGKQSRDILHVSDLVHCYDRAIERPDRCQGEAFNIGGGPQRVISLLELIALLKRGVSTPIELAWDDWRPGDQPVFVCDISKAEARLGWSPAVSVEEGVTSLIDWVREHRSLFD